MNSTDVTNIIDYYKNAVGDGITVEMFLQTCGMTIVFFLIRFLILLKMDNIPIFKPKTKADKSKRSYLFGHITIEMLIAFAISYSMLILRGAQPENYVWNMIVAPGVGLVVAVMIDLKIIMKDEVNAPLALSINKFSKKSHELTSGNTNATPSINVQVNTGNGNIEVHDSSNSSEIAHPQLIKEHISDEITNSEEFNQEILNAVNCLIDVQSSHDTTINKLSKQTDDIQNVITNLQKVEMRKHQFQLKNMIYACLSKGYATPQENEEIESSYYNYINLLNGNGEVKALHDTRYINIEIRED